MNYCFILDILDTSYRNYSCAHCREWSDPKSLCPISSVSDWLFCQWDGSEFIGTGPLRGFTGHQVDLVYLEDQTHGTNK